MPTSSGLSTFSDWTFVTATAIYLIAMVLILVEHSLTRAVKTKATAPALVAVGAGAPESALESTEDTETGVAGSTPEPPAAHRSRADRFGRMGVAQLALGAVLHFAAIVLRGLSAGRWPLGNMYEYVMFVTFIAVVTWLVVISRFPVRRMSAWVLLPVAGLMLLDGKILYADSAPVMPALQSYWLIIHVTTAATASGLLILPGLASICYLFRSAHERSPKRFAFAAKLPTADLLDRLAYRSSIIGFPLFTFAVICGAVWAEEAWGRYWGWDPKETTAFVAWVVYAAYLHARATSGWRGQRAAWVNVVGFAVMMFNLFFVNLMVSGLHSYAGVN